MTKIIDLNKHRRKTKTERVDNDAHNFLVCPYCMGSYFAPLLLPKGTEYSVIYLVCVSELCQGDVYVEVYDGVLDAHFMEIRPTDQPPDDGGDNDNSPPNAA